MFLIFPWILKEYDVGFGFEPTILVSFPILYYNLRRKPQGHSHRYLYYSCSYCKGILILFQPHILRNMVFFCHKYCPKIITSLRVFHISTVLKCNNEQSMVQKTPFLPFYSIFLVFSSTVLYQIFIALFTSMLNSVMFVMYY